MTANTNQKQVKVTMIRSSIGAIKIQKANLEALGLKKVGDSKVFADGPVVRGMVKRVSHLVKVEEI